MFLNNIRFSSSKKIMALTHCRVKNLDINHCPKNSSNGITNHGITTLIECHNPDVKIVKNNDKIKEYFKLVFDEIGVEFSLDNIDEYPNYLHQQVLDKAEGVNNNVKYMQIYGSAYTNISFRMFYRENKMFVDIFSIRKYYPGDIGIITNNFFDPCKMTYESIPRYF